MVESESLLPVDGSKNLLEKADDDQTRSGLM